MAKPHTDETSAPSADLLTHLAQAFGWTEAQAIAALGTYMMSSDAGKALSQELALRDRPERAA
jgi:hypothetical protein